MQLKDQCSSLDPSTKLKELGFEQKSLFCWVVLEDLKDKHKKFVPEIWMSSDIGGYNQSQNGKSRMNKIASAYTVAELGEMLPKFFASHRENKYRCFGGKFIFSEEADTEADARAKMLIYLKNESYI